MYNNATTSGNIHNLTMQAHIGRPRAPMTIVDNVIPALQLMQTSRCCLRGYR